MDGEFEKVDLITTDKNLEDIMISEYEEPLFLSQIIKRNFGGVKLYIFKDLTKPVVENFLVNYVGSVLICSSQLTDSLLKSSYSPNNFFN